MNRYKTRTIEVAFSRTLHKVHAVCSISSVTSSRYYRQRSRVENRSRRCCSVLSASYHKKLSYVKSYQRLLHGVSVKPATETSLHVVFLRMQIIEVLVMKLRVMTKNFQRIACFDFFIPSQICFENINTPRTKELQALIFCFAAAFCLNEDSRLTYY